MRHLKRLGIVIAVLMVGVLVGSVAAATLTSRTGTVDERHVFVSQNTPFVTASAPYVNVPGAAISVVVPTGTTRLIDARYTAESLCSGSAGWCTVRVVVVNVSTGATAELHPQSGTDFAFDATGDMWESHAIERSTILGPGSYRLVVQAARIAPATSLRLDDWHFAVVVIRR